MADMVEIVFQDLVEARKSEAEDLCDEQHDALAAVSDSPIEMIFGLALAKHQGGNWEIFTNEFRVEWNERELVKSANERYKFWWLEHCAAIGFQVPIKCSQAEFRADFLMMYAYDDGIDCRNNKYEPAPRFIKIVIECDGHDYHEKTKEQARRDKARDRALTASGYRVVRFTGSEIYSDPHGCVEELWRVAVGLGVQQRRADREIAQ